MGYQWKDIPVLLRSEPGRSILKVTLQDKAWPIIRPLAWLHRRWALKNSRLIAVTGSFGKTTTTYVISEAMGGCWSSIYRNNTGALALKMLTAPWGRDRLVMEVGAGQGQMAAQAQVLKPQVAVVTCVGSEHNARYSSLRDVRDAKVQLVKALPQKGLAVLNGDDANVSWMASHTNAKVIKVGFGEHNDFQASHYRVNWPHGSLFVVRTKNESHQVGVPLFGKHQVYSCLAAIAVGLNEGFQLEQVLENLSRLMPLSNRMQPVRLQNGAWLIRDDYKSHFETIKASLAFFALVPARRRFVVIGNISEVQNPQRPKYKELGALIGPLAYKVFYFGTNYRDLKSGLHSAGFDQENLIYCRDGLHQAVGQLGNELQAEDVVLIKGRHSQRLSRVALALMGKKVRCELDNCYSMALACEGCPKLEKGW